MQDSENKGLNELDHSTFRLSNKRMKIKLPGKFFMMALSLGFCCGWQSFGQSFIIPEPALQRAISNSLGVAERDLTEKMVSENLVRLEANDLQIRDLSGLEKARNLEYLVLRDNLIEDLEPLQKLSKLRKLDLAGNRLKNLSSLIPLSAVELRKTLLKYQSEIIDPKLSDQEKASVALNLSEASELLNSGDWALFELNLSRNRLLGLSGIENFKFLVHLDVSHNSLIDLEGVSKLRNLVNFYAHGNELGRVEEYVDRNRNKQFDPGEPFTDQSGNGKRDTDPLIEIQGLPKLTDLHLYDNRLNQISSMGDLPSMTTLLLSGNEISEVGSLKQFHNLRQLSLANNRINTFDELDKLTTIERLNLAENHICDLRPLRELKDLRSLDLRSNLVINLHDLSELKELENLGLSYNLIHDPSPVLALPKLKRLSLGNNRISLDEKSVEDSFRLAEARGVYLNFRNQKSRSMQAENLVRSLIGYPHTNKVLADFLRNNGYRNLIDFLDDNRIKDEGKASALDTWNDALKRTSRLDFISFPSN